MRTPSKQAWIAMAIAATTLAVVSPAAAHSSPVEQRPGVARAAVTDFSARQKQPHRAHHHARRHHPPAYRRSYVYAPRGYYDYNARPHWYRPDAVAPFFPFGFGWGLGPSW